MNAKRHPSETEFEAAAYAHVEETAQSIAQMHAAHHQSASLQQRRIDQVTALLGKPCFIGTVGLLMALWVGFNTFAGPFGVQAIDPPPFPGLAAVISLASLCIMLLVLATQRRENELAEKREQLTLELALLSERKSAKIIDLLEEFRRDLPNIEDRVDAQADALAQPADPEKVLEVIAETHEQAVAPEQTEE